MGIESVSLIDEQPHKSIFGGFLQFDLTRVYQVITTDREDGAGTIETAPGIPLLKQPLSVGGIIVWCLDTSAARVNTDATGRKWHVTCQFSNNTGKFERDINGNPTDTLEDIVPVFDFDYREVRVPTNTARFVRITKRNGNSVVPPPYLLERQFNNPKGPITNSAGSVIPDTTITHQKILKYAKYVRDWDNTWDDLRLKTNSTPCTFTESDIDGERLSQTYPANTLLMGAIKKQNIRREGKLWYRVMFMMLHNELTWRHFQPDQGMQRRLFEGQYKPDTTVVTSREWDQYTLQEFIEATPYTEFQTIVGTTEKGQEVTLSEPVPFNGYGAEIPAPRPEFYDMDEKFILEFDKYEEADLATGMGL